MKKNINTKNFMTMCSFLFAVLSSPYQIMGVKKPPAAVSFQALWRDMKQIKDDVKQEKITRYSDLKSALNNLDTKGLYDSLHDFEIFKKTGNHLDGIRLHSPLGMVSAVNKSAIYGLWNNRNKHNTFPGNINLYDVDRSIKLNNIENMVTFYKELSKDNGIPASTKVKAGAKVFRKIATIKKPSENLYSEIFEIVENNFPPQYTISSNVLVPMIESAILSNNSIKNVDAMLTACTPHLQPSDHLQLFKIIVSKKENGIRYFTKLIESFKPNKDITLKISKTIKKASKTIKPEDTLSNTFDNGERYRENQMLKIIEKYKKNNIDKTQKNKIKLI